MSKTCEYFVRYVRFCGAPATHVSTWNANGEGFREISCCPHHAIAIDRNAQRLGEPRTMVSR
jgi:hypothetical protein